MVTVSNLRAPMVAVVPSYSMDIHSDTSHHPIPVSLAHSPIHSNVSILPGNVPHGTKSTGPGTTQHTDLNQFIMDFAKMQSAPKPTLDTFSGDPLDYIYFRMAFKNVVESCVSDLVCFRILVDLPKILLKLVLTALMLIVLIRPWSCCTKTMAIG